MTCCLLFLLAACGKSDSEPDSRTGFLDALFAWYPDLIVESVDIDGYTADEQALVDSALARADGFAPFHPPVDEPGEMVYVQMKRQGLERAAVMLSGTGVQEEAADYLKDAVVYYEWEGFADGPLAEAACAEDYLSAHPGTRLEGFLTVFLLHRYRAAWECGISMEDSEIAATALASYRYWHHAAEELGDPMILLAAKEIDEAGCIYMLQVFPEWRGAD
jgi:hypothetical protein